jgi:hypothetical protein
VAEKTETTPPVAKKRKLRRIAPPTFDMDGLDYGGIPPLFEGDLSPKSTYEEMSISDGEAPAQSSSAAEAQGGALALPSAEEERAGPLARPREAPAERAGPAAPATGDPRWDEIAEIEGVPKEDRQYYLAPESLRTVTVSVRRNVLPLEDTDCLAIFVCADHPMWVRAALLRQVLVWSTCRSVLDAQGYATTPRRQPCRTPPSTQAQEKDGRTAVDCRGYGQDRSGYRSPTKDTEN